MSRKGPRSSASSSSAAAFGGGRSPAFTSFAAATAEVLGSQSSGASTTSVISEWDSSTILVLKSCTKKDEVTRGKAITDISALIKQLPASRDGNIGAAFVNAWGTQFPVLATDSAPNIRSAAFEVMGDIVSTFTKTTTPILKSVLPHWVAALGDPIASVAATASLSIAKAFPSDTVKKKLVQRFGSALRDFCLTEIKALSASGDEVQLRRIVAVVRWTIETSSSLDFMSPLLDENHLYRIATGIKTSKKGFSSIAAPREACEIGHAAILPVLASDVGNISKSELDDYQENSHMEDSVKAALCRAKKLGDLAIAVIRNGDAGGWDLLLALLRNGWHDSVTNWREAKAAFKKCLKNPAPAVLNALLPLFHLLPPNQSLSSDVAMHILEALHKMILPESFLAVNTGSGNDLSSSMDQVTVGDTTMSSNSAMALVCLPSYLECLAHTIRSGSRSWISDEFEEAAFRDNLVERHVKPVILAYLKGRLLAPHNTITSQLNRRQSSDSVEDRGIAVKPQLFSVVACALESRTGHAVMTWIASNLLPLSRQSDILVQRLVKFLDCLHQGNAAYSIAFMRELFPLLLSRQMAAELQFTNLQILAGVSDVILDLTLIASETEEADLVQFALSQSNRPNHSSELGESVGAVLSWVCLLSRFEGKAELSSSVVSATLFASRDDLHIASCILRDLLCAHSKKRRRCSSLLSPSGDPARASVCNDNLHWQPLASSQFDEFVVHVARQATSSEVLRTPDQYETLASFLREALVTDGGAALGDSAYFEVVSLISLALPLSKGYVLTDVSDAILSAPPTVVGNNDAIMALVTSLIVHRAVEFVECGKGGHFTRAWSFLENLRKPMREEYIHRVLAAMQQELLSARTYAENAYRAKKFAMAWLRLLNCLAITSDQVLTQSEALREMCNLAKASERANHATNEKMPVFYDIFAASLLLSSGPSYLFVVDGAERIIEPSILVREFERVSTLEHIGEEELAVDVQALLRDVVEREMSKVKSICNIASVTTSRLMELGDELSKTDMHGCGDFDGAIFQRMGARRKQLLLQLLETLVLHDVKYPDVNRSFPVMSTFAAATNMMNSFAPDVVAACTLQSQVGCMTSFRTMLESAARSIHSKHNSADSDHILILFASALAVNEDRYLWHEHRVNLLQAPDWFHNLLRGVLQDVHRLHENSSPVFAHVRSRGSELLVVYRAIVHEFEMDEDDLRFWMLRVLYGLREYQLMGSEVSTSSIANERISALSLLAAVIVRAFERNWELLRHIDSRDIDEIIFNGAWAGIRYYSNGNTQDVIGLLFLMANAEKSNLMYPVGLQSPVDQNSVYSLIDLFRNAAGVTRNAAFLTILHVATQSLPVLAREQLSGTDFIDENLERETINKIVPDEIQKALTWHASAADQSNDSEYEEELRYFMSWLLFLEFAQGTLPPAAVISAEVDTRKDSTDLEDMQQAENEDCSYRRVVLSFLRCHEELFSEYFSRCSVVIVEGSVIERAAAAQGASTILSQPVSDWIRKLDANASLEELVGCFAGASFAQALQRLPALSRVHVMENTARGTTAHLEEFVRRRISPNLIWQEIRRVRAWSLQRNGSDSLGGDGELRARGSAAAREVWASYTLSDVTLEVALRLPETFPLQNAKVLEDSDGVNHVCMSRNLWRKTLLGMNTLLRLKDSSLAEALELWRRNLDKTLEGAEECPICYSVLHLATGALPKMQCRTCKTNFHSICLCRWFTKSSNSSCPLCRSPF